MLADRPAAAALGFVAGVSNEEVAALSLEALGVRLSDLGPVAVDAESARGRRAWAEVLPPAVVESCRS